MVQALPQAGLPTIPLRLASGADASYRRKVLSRARHIRGPSLQVGEDNEARLSLMNHAGGDVEPSEYIPPR